MQLDERKRKILLTIATTYARTGEPVGSKSVAELLGGTISSATIRNDMAALFDLGLLEQPHTSAGRIPSHLGYRLYIDQLLSPQPLDSENRDEIDAMFNVRNPDPDRLLEDAAVALAALTGCATISTTITPASVTVKRVDIIPAGLSTVAILIIASNGVIKNKVCRVDFLVTPKVIEFFTAFAKGRIAGHTLEELTLQYLNSVGVSLGDYSQLFTPILAAIYELCREIYGGQFYIAGQTNLLRYPEYKNAGYDLLRFLSHKEKVLELVDGSPGRTTTIHIGPENPQAELMGSSVVVTKYNIGRHTTGAIGIIGPVRLDYETAIPKVEYFAQTMGALLSETFEEQESDYPE